VSRSRGQGLAVLGLAVVGAVVAGCATCRGGSPVVMQRPGLGGAIGSSGQGSLYPTGGVGLDLSNLFCRSPDPALQPQPGPGSPPIQDPAPGPPKSKELPAGAAPI
jgi:hypothetical protein